MWPGLSPWLVDGGLHVLMMFSLWVCLGQISVKKMPVILYQSPTLLIFTNYIHNDCFQIRSHPEVLWAGLLYMNFSRNTI